MNSEFWKTHGLSVFFLVCMLGMSLPFTVRHGSRLFWALSSLGWQEVEAEVISTRIHTQGIPGKRRSYETAVRYRYPAGGVFYESERISFDPVFLNTYQKTLDVAAFYPEGSRVPAFFDPRRPDQSVLTPGVHWSHYLFFSAGIFFTALSLAFGYLLLKKGPPS